MALIRLIRLWATQQTTSTKIVPLEYTTQITDTIGEKAHVRQVKDVHFLEYFLL